MMVGSPFGKTLMASNARQAKTMVEYYRVFLVAFW
jgi:hypothetical protein